MIQESVLSRSLIIRSESYSYDDCYEHCSMDRMQSLSYVDGDAHSSYLHAVSKPANYIELHAHPSDIRPRDDRNASGLAL